MTGEQFHLMINHLPIVGAFIGLVLVVFSAVRQGDSGVRYAAALVMAISAAGGGAAFFSGEDAEHAAEERPAFNHDLVEEHEDGAKWAGILLAGAAAVGGWLSLLTARGKAVPVAGTVGWVVLSALAAATMTRTGLSGRMMEHGEVYGAPPANHE